MSSILQACMTVGRGKGIGMGGQAAEMEFARLRAWWIWRYSSHAC